ncbi:hypothetical protein [Methanobacterium petrolearium]|uniref:hypothetical protein n=1 Tax=Methanobacterium petrolearium TaxID=710190 RepID=UPI001AE3A1B6|nr:hypothetical protein [Methanobacterium petrolearium]MBP1944955.1 hypothetical protein [Methanobacterium petrolearium]BDZ70273.1 hypothetical protein GCM10025861_07900 [Methanobacterium petrolearium]
MAKKDKIKVSDNSCGCSIDDLMNDKAINHIKPHDRLCGAKNSDMEFFIDPDPEKISQEFYQRRLTDGLPIIPPTRERVDRFLKYSQHPPDEVIAVLPPKMGKATPEKIAINAVMAGCLPSFQPLLEQVIKAISHEKFNLAGVNATTHPVSICTIINGPLAGQLGLNSSVGCLGPGNLTNATIGRAMRLCLINIAGAIPGVGDHATHGSPAKYSFCFAENEEKNPWESLHVERGYCQEDSAVTVIAAEAPHNVNDHRSQTAEELLDTIINTATTAGCNNSHVPGEILVIMSPEHAQTINRNGWSKKDVQRYIHQNSHLPVVLGDRGGRKLDEKLIINGNVHITRSPQDVVLVVAGGPGRHTMISHGFGSGSESITLKIDTEPE